MKMMLMIAFFAWPGLFILIFEKEIAAPASPPNRIFHPKRFQVFLWGSVLMFLVGSVCILLAVITGLQDGFINPSGFETGEFLNARTWLLALIITYWPLASIVYGILGVWIGGDCLQSLGWSPFQEWKQDILHPFDRINRPNGQDRRSQPDLDVRRTVTITAAQAARGCAVRIMSPSGNRVQISIPEGVQTGTELRVDRQGIKEGLSVGDIYLKVDIREDA